MSLFSFVIEALVGVLLGVVLFRLGLPSLMPVLIWLPALDGMDMSGIAIGLIASSVWQLSRSLLTRTTSFPFPIGIALVCAGVGLLVVDYFFVFISFLEPVLPFFLVVMTGLLVYFSSLEWKGRLVSGFVALVCFLVGWYSLHVWVIPLALPGLLMGLFGFSSSPNASPSVMRSTHAWSESVMGVGLGVLPGLGPGLMGLLWHSAGFSPLTGIANLVFSVGFVSLSGKIRSMPAEALASVALPWHILFLILLACVGVGWGLERLLPSSPWNLSLSFWVVLHLAAFMAVGSLSTLGIVILGWCLRHCLEEWHFPPAWGLLVLLPPIVWFYS